MTPRTTLADTLHLSLTSPLETLLSSNDISGKSCVTLSMQNLRLRFTMQARGGFGQLFSCSQQDLPRSRLLHSRPPSALEHIHRHHMSVSAGRISLRMRPGSAASCSVVLLAACQADDCTHRYAPFRALHQTIGYCCALCRLSECVGAGLCGVWGCLFSFKRTAPSTTVLLGLQRTNIA